MPSIKSQNSATPTCCRSIVFWYITIVLSSFSPLVFQLVDCLLLNNYTLENTDMIKLYVDRGSSTYTICRDQSSTSDGVTLNASLSVIDRETTYGDRRIFFDWCLITLSNESLGEETPDTRIVVVISDVPKGVVLHVTQRHLFRSLLHSTSRKTTLRQGTTVTESSRCTGDAEGYFATLFAFSYRGHDFAVATKRQHIKNSNPVPSHYLVKRYDCKQQSIVVSCKAKEEVFTNVTAVDADLIEGRVLLYMAFSDGPTNLRRERLLCTFDATELLDDWIGQGTVNDVRLASWAKMRLQLTTVVFSTTEIEELITVNIDNRSLVIYRDSVDVRIVSQVSPQSTSCKQCNACKFVKAIN